jgi:hypothetical protein
MGGASQPFLEFDMEAALCLAGLQFQEAQDQRAGETEQGGAERRCHALERTVDAGLEPGEHLHRVAARDLQAVDGVGNGADGFQQAPEGTEQAEEDQQPDQIAREFAPLVETGRDAVEQGARGGRREPEMVLLFAQHGGHRRQQVDRVGLEQGRTLFTVLEAAQPPHFGPQRDDLAHDEEDADHEHAHDHAVQDRRVQEHAQQILVQQVGETRDGCQEQQHADQIGQGIAHAFSRRRGAAGG